VEEKINKMKKIMDELKYPDTQYYSVDGLQPLNESTKKRMNYLNTNIPELFDGESIIDIGSSKGAIGNILNDKWKSYIGFEPHKESCELAQNISNFHKFKQNKFINTDFRGINCFNKTEPLNADIVFVGNVHHYFFEAEQKVGMRFLFMQKLSCMAKKYLIIDGAFEVNDGAVQILIEQNKWTKEDIKSYTFKNYEDSIKSHFKLIKKITNQAGVRETAVFERIRPNAENVVYNQEELKDSEILNCNINRQKGDIIKKDNIVYKKDKHTINDNTIYVLNKLPEFYPKFKVLIDDKGNKLGITKTWIEAKVFEDINVLFEKWIEYNAIINTIGLFEPALKRDDILENPNGILFDIDEDMIYHVEDIYKIGVDKKETYMDKWFNQNKKIKEYSTEKLEKIKDNLLKENIFLKIK
jgi:hypothetical protein